MSGVEDVSTGAAHTSEPAVIESYPLMEPTPMNDGAAAAGAAETTSAPRGSGKDSGAAPPVGAIRSLSGTPSMERESERPDAEGGYENDQPPATLVNPPLYAQS